MNAPRDPDRLIRAFLEEGPTELPARVFDETRRSIDRTRQRVFVVPWRYHRMSWIANLAATAVAVMAIFAIGLSVVPRAGNESGGAASPDPSVTPTPSFAAYTWPGRLAAGTYSTDFAYVLPEAMTFTVGDGWESRDINITKDGHVSLMLLDVENLHADPCSGVLRDPPTGPMVDDLADALGSMPGLEATIPTDAALGGLTGKYLEYQLAPDAGCSASAARIFDIAPLVCDVGCTDVGSGDVGVEFPVPGVSHRAWVLDPGGRGRLLLLAISSPDATAAELEELLTVVGSVRFVRTAPVTPPPLPASS